MTREEEIRQAALESIKDTPSYFLNKEFFIDGAHWADNHPNKGLVDINSVCGWLIGNTYKYLIDNTHFRGTGDIDMDKLIQDFRKALEVEL